MTQALSPLLEPKVASSATRKSFDELAVAIETKGWGYSDNILTLRCAEDLRKNLIAFSKDSKLRPAEIGRGVHQHRRESIRGDWILWLESQGRNEAEKLFLREMDRLREYFAARFFLPIKTFESHYAIYSKGTQYERHLDQHDKQNARKLSCVFYLNPSWKESDGGQLRIYSEKDPTQVDAEVAPIQGRLVVFLSNNIWHEVLPSNTERLSVSGWFRS
jgi:SM-20-related protein